MNGKSTSAAASPIALPCSTSPRGPRGPAKVVIRKAAATSARAARTDCGSSRLATITSAPRWRRLSAVDPTPLRVIARTITPAPRRASTVAPPCLPVAPNTATGPDTGWLLPEVIIPSLLCAVVEAFPAFLVNCIQNIPTPAGFSGIMKCDLVEALSCETFPEVDRPCRCGQARRCRSEDTASRAALRQVFTTGNVCVTYHIHFLFSRRVRS